ncbi:MAG: 1,4-alpha-glucan branching protein GlgB [Acidimicrobiia bacterium]|nr:1,4-alpha-glucan branching protein GlgB [Acidimicrobiia bacterium]
MQRDLTDQDLWLFAEGNHERAYEFLGCHPLVDGGADFAVWAPNAEWVSVIGDFNGWNDAAAPMTRGENGIWNGTVHEASHGDAYKYLIRSHGYAVEKADPYAVHNETPPATASKVWVAHHDWSDGEWMKTRAERSVHDAPISIYEVHLGSWRRDQWVDYRGIADPLVEYVTETGFTHVEFLPLTEHPYYGSWGYQTTGYFAPTARYGPPEDLMYLIDRLHGAGIAVIMDWVPSHFPTDEHGLGFFDGTHLYEHADPRQGFHPDWKSFIFNYDRGEVSSFLLSSAHWWLDAFHIDGLRVDAVASMLYLDYSRKDGEWIPNARGGRENLGAIEFLKRLNTTLYGRFPGIQTYAEESTSWPLVTRPVDQGGLGFGYKWDMGWMNDTLDYLHIDPFFRGDNHHKLTFRQIYATSENYVLSLSHDEMVHGKRSLRAKQPGDRWRQFAGLRTLFGYQWGLPGKKLIMMGSEIAQEREWNHEAELDWGLLDDPDHAGVRRWVTDLNRWYRDNPAMHRGDHEGTGFVWVDANDNRRSVYSFLRRAPGEQPVLVVCNFAATPWEGLILGVPHTGKWTMQLDSDSTDYGGTGWGRGDPIVHPEMPSHDQPHSLVVDVPALATLMIRSETRDT